MLYNVLNLFVLHIQVATCEDLFSSKKLRKFNLDIDPVALNKLRALPLKRNATYGSASSDRTRVACNLMIDYGTAEADPYPGVDCAYEGHGTLMGCTDPNTGAISEGRRPHYPKNLSSFHDFGCRRAGWEVATGVIREPRIRGLNKLLFHGMTWCDWSLMRERLADQTMHDMGMLVSRVVGALLYVNGVELGIFNLVEVVDDSFLRHRRLKGTLFWESWMTSTNAQDYDDKIFVGTTGTNAAQPLADLRIAAEGCLKHGCDEVTARKIVQNYTVEETWLDALFSLSVFYNFDSFVNMWVDVGNHNFGLFLDEQTPNKITMIPWDFSEALRVVPQFEDLDMDRQFSGGAQLLGLYGTGAMFTPPWFYLPTAAERKTLCDENTPSDMVHFTCDKVGQVMTIAWRRVFFDYIQKYLQTNMSTIPPRSMLQRANDYVSMWTAQYLPSVTRQTLTGGLPTVDDFKQQSSVALQMFASGLTDLSIRANARGGDAMGWSAPLPKIDRVASAVLSASAPLVPAKAYSPTAMMLAFLMGAASFAAASCITSRRPGPDWASHTLTQRLVLGVSVP